ncbi:hypothetical protein KKH23_10955 [Patescibacteria group bacterium]|nr:hypothetical protein [Patescibacteria group bacterium]MBU1067256.1 hypothetical protein [Patescibacteria group bacterium]
MSTTKSLEFVLEFQERPVTIGSERYLLVELDGKGRDTYLNNLGGRMRHGPDGKPSGVKDFEGLQAFLVAACLRKIEADGELRAVSGETIQAWPAKVVSGLFDAAKELSALDEEEEEGKND